MNSTELVTESPYAWASTVTVDILILSGKLVPPTMPHISISPGKFDPPSPTQFIRLMAYLLGNVIEISSDELELFGKPVLVL